MIDINILQNDNTKNYSQLLLPYKMETTFLHHHWEVRKQSHVLQAWASEESCRCQTLYNSMKTISCREKKNLVCPVIMIYDESNIQALINGKVIKADTWKHPFKIKEQYNQIIKNSWILQI